MRPEILFSLFMPAQNLNGVGPKVAKALDVIGCHKILDLLFLSPRYFIKRNKITTIQAQDDPMPESDNQIIADIQVLKHNKAPKRNLPHRVECLLGQDSLQLIFFNMDAKWLANTLPVNSMRTIAGKLEFYNDQVQIIHPEYILATSQEDTIPKIEPVYSLAAGLSAKLMRKLILQAQNLMPQLPEWHDKQLLQNNQWPSWNESVLCLHTSDPGYQNTDLYRTRLAYDELLANQLALLLTREHANAKVGRALQFTGKLSKQIFTQKLAFTLTQSQQRVISEIYTDMRAPTRMLRMLQGDVGSGKTLVAFAAILAACESNCQATLIAPTEILAQQHLKTIATLLEGSQIEFVFLSGKETAKARNIAIQKLADGSAHIAIGTHALLQDNIKFKDLALAIIDEQHRFGVEQRLAIAQKGNNPDLLVMSATPIPRSLAMVAYADLDQSRLDELPPGRQSITTSVISENKVESLINKIKVQKDSSQVFWVCPLIEESQTLKCISAEQRFATLLQYFDQDELTLLHGRMHKTERHQAMENFASGKARIMVATTVIEVGVDIPSAEIMVVEHAERFGLAQLHQLRGRIGRGQNGGHCILLYHGFLSNTQKDRLHIMRQHHDGFYIAEEDLRLRGSGEVLGTRQSGVPDFYFADYVEHKNLFKTARQDALALLSKDPLLKSQRGQALRTLLYLFSRDSAINNLNAG